MLDGYGGFHAEKSLEGVGTAMFAFHQSDPERNRSDLFHSRVKLNRVLNRHEIVVVEQRFSPVFSG